MRITGPAIVTDPAGGVWCSLLGGNGALVRIEPSTEERTLYVLPKPARRRVAQVGMQRMMANAHREGTSRRAY